MLISAWIMPFPSFSLSRTPSGYLLTANRTELHRVYETVSARAMDDSWAFFASGQWLSSTTVIIQAAHSPGWYVCYLQSRNFLLSLVHWDLLQYSVCLCRTRLLKEIENGKWIIYISVSYRGSPLGCFLGKVFLAFSLSMRVCAKPSPLSPSSHWDTNQTEISGC